jgi:predicted NUDIX family NTP pyrophosphohydrolase
MGVHWPRARCHSRLIVCLLLVNILSQMAKKTSAGILVYRRRDPLLEVFLVHPGGPFWEKKDDGSWSIPKGEYEVGADALEAAKREFSEETSFTADGAFVPLTPLKQPSGKLISAWAVEGDLDSAKLRSNTFRMEWPPKSGAQQEFPEVDRGGWFDLENARRKLLPGQLPFLTELASILGERDLASCPANDPL